MDIGATEAKIAIKILELAVKQGWLDKLLNAFRKKHAILVLGSTGTGKTNFLQSLTELAPQAIDHMNRTEFARKNSIKIQKQPFIFLEYSSVFHKFYGEGSISGRFDESDRARARGNLLSTLLAAVGKGSLYE